MAWITDSLRGAMDLASRLNPFSRIGGADTTLPGMFTHQLALSAYMASGMMRKVISIPASDRTQKWRDWQADKDTIAQIEAEEKRLGLRAKVKEAEILRGTGGGALVIITAGEHEKPLDPNSIGPNSIVAINVVSRWEITPKDFEKDLASLDYRKPRYFEINGGEKTQQKIHPSRVICFRGDTVPPGGAIDDVETFWGDSRLLQVFSAVQNSDHTQVWFVELVKKAKLLRIGIPDLIDMLSTPAGKQQLNERIALIAQGESTLNATVYRSGTGTDDPGEKIDDYQVTWAGIPAFMDAVDQRLAAVSGIPFTKLMGRSPGGMNATGDSDMNNWWDTVGDGQENEVRPCLEQLDPFLLRSAGVANPDAAWWVWAPLRKPTEKEEAETFKLLMEAVTALIASGMVPDEAMSRAVQNLIEERGYMPGLADALAKIPEPERFGLNPDASEDDPSAIQTNSGKEGIETSPTVRAPSGRRALARAANDARPMVASDLGLLENAGNAKE